jgi:hypothetical protein
MDTRVPSPRMTKVHAARVFILGAQLPPSFAHRIHPFGLDTTESFALSFCAIA